ncbi:DUF7827 domain-containing protein [Haloplanus aerogenes]|uniref:DUF7827 domain-containing protein n=1 Tax=Haloplanus aerogenes TaxID=660522 RepID=A0A3G8QWK3_9EURY|nr:hypothetical protein [Haloplanus aerogenes]AZH26615.1 hypothetical protein DU502_15075 [Haloplanus aerogenes]
MGLVLVCSLLLASASVGGVVTAQEADNLRFADAVTTEQRGDVARIPIRVGDRRYVALSVRSPTGTYDTRIRVVDADGDGRVVVTIDTFRAGWTADESTAYAAGPGDRVTAVDRRTRRLDGPLPERRYNLVAASGSDSTSASLILDAGSVGAATAATIPADRLAGDAAAVPATHRFETDRIATGDHAVVAFNVSGIGGVLASTSPPGTNLVFPTDSMPGATTTHTVSVDTDRRITTETITVRYADGGAPQRFGRFDTARIRALGVDTDGDGIVDTDRLSTVESVDTTRSGTAITIHLDTAVTVDDDDTLLVDYRATNPAEAGTYPVQASLGDGADADGHVVYGVAGRGTLGYGLDLRFVAEDNETVVDPLAAVDYHYADDRLYALVNTSTLSVGQRYSVGLIRWGASPVAEETRSASASMRITERGATLVDPTPDDPFVVGGGETTIRAETTVAPTTEVVVEVIGDTPNSFLFRQATRVGADRTVTARFDLPTAVDRQSITVRVVDNGTVLEQERGVIATESGGE